MQIAYPFQYGQPDPLNRLRSLLWAANFVLRRALSTLPVIGGAGSRAGDRSCILYTYHIMLYFVVYYGATMRCTVCIRPPSSMAYAALGPGPVTTLPKRYMTLYHMI